METPELYPIAEIFESIQGEGTFVGYPTTFVRFAGCNVGRTTSDLSNPLGTFIQCESVSSGKFPCDTDFTVKQRYTLTALIAHINKHNVQRVCITGGEPFIHDLLPLVRALRRGPLQIETSGTKAIPAEVHDYAWITCSPKQGFLHENVDKVDDWKFLVGSETQAEDIVNFCCLHNISYGFNGASIFLQPVEAANYALAIRNALGILNRYPHWRLSAQLHKYLQLR